MGTRLYPQTKSPEKLETLAKVSKGTFARLQKIRELQQQLEAVIKSDPEFGSTAVPQVDELDYLGYKQLMQAPEAAKLDNFLIFGWGKVKFNPSFPLSYVNNSTTDPEEVNQILALHGLPFYDMELTEGLCWS